MKSKFTGVLFAVILLFTACTTGQASMTGALYTAYTSYEIAEQIIAAQTDISRLNSLTPDGEFFWDYLTERYQIDTTEIEILDGVIFYAGGVIVDEIAILLLADENDAPTVRNLLAEYANRRRIIFASYAPVQAGILGNSIAIASGNHVALLITEDPQGAEATFSSMFSDSPVSRAEPVEEIPAHEETPVETPPREEPHIYEETPHIPYADEPDTLPANEEPYSYEETESEPYEETPEAPPSPPDRYNRAAILRALEVGDTSELSPMNRRIFYEYLNIIDLLISPDMTELEQKLAILRWIVIHSVYDPEFLSNAPDASPNPHNENPYGLIFYQLAICFGFAETFQLFMDFLGIECITVHGYDFTEGRHVWNLVYIDGIWSAVDVTLETTLHNPLGVGPDHVPESVNHRHVNLSCDYLWDSRGHRWDRDAYPVAVGR